MGKLVRSKRVRQKIIWIPFSQPQSSAHEALCSGKMLGAGPTMLCGAQLAIGGGQWVMHYHGWKKCSGTFPLVLPHTEKCSYRTPYCILQINIDIIICHWSMHLFIRCCHQLCSKWFHQKKDFENHNNRKEHGRHNFWPPQSNSHNIHCADNVDDNIRWVCPKEISQSNMCNASYL